MPVREERIGSDAGRRERWLVAGRVQGVGFRWFVTEAARRYGVRGDVRNLPDGRVEVRVIGPAARVDGLEQEVRRGPRVGRVDDVTRSELDDDLDFQGFVIRR